MIVKKLGRKKAHRESVIRNLAASLVVFETVNTTVAKAKTVKSFIDKLLARAQKNDLATRRALLGILYDKNAVDKIFNELVDRYRGRKSGFVKSYHLKERLGDNAPMMRLELVDKKTFITKEIETGAEPKKVKENETK
jgi:large subunit ribosomal protein L17